MSENADLEKYQGLVLEVDQLRGLVAQLVKVMEAIVYLSDDQSAAHVLAYGVLSDDHYSRWRKEHGKE